MKTLVYFLERLDTLEQEITTFTDRTYRGKLLTAINDARNFLMLNQNKFLKFVNENPLTKEHYIMSDSVTCYDEELGAILCLDRKHRMMCMFRCCESGFSIKEYETEARLQANELEFALAQVPSENEIDTQEV
jgi:hypothetical protein